MSSVSRFPHAPNFMDVLNFRIPNFTDVLNFRSCGRAGVLCGNAETGPSCR